MEISNETYEFIYCWGFGKYGQLGKKFINFSLLPLKLTLEEEIEIECIKVGECHNSILSKDKKLYTFGKNAFGQLGLGNNNYVHFPMFNLISVQEKIVKVSCGGDHTLLLTDTNKLLSFGLNVFGQLGLCDFKKRNTPTIVNEMTSIDCKTNERSLQSFLENNSSEFIVDIAAGAQHSLVLTSNNTIFSAGCGMSKALAHDSEKDSNIFLLIDFSLKYKESVSRLTAGVYHSGCVLDETKLCLWGIGEVLKYDTPTVVNIKMLDTPSRSRSSKANQIINLKIGEDFVVVQLSDFSLFLAGTNKDGQLGNGTNESSNSFQELKIDSQKIVKADIGYNYGILLTDEDQVYGWGNNEFGQLCITTSNKVYKPELIKPLSGIKIKAIICGGYHALSISGSKTPDQKSSNDKIKSNLKIKDGNEEEKYIEEMEAMLSTNYLQSTLKNDSFNLKNKFKLIDTLKGQLNELENLSREKDKILKELMLKEEEYKKEEEVININIDSKPDPKFIQSRGFDNNFEVPMEEIEFFKDDIGKGTFGEVKKGVWRKEIVAVKFLKYELLNSDDNIKAFIEECNILKNLRHPHILLFMGAGTKHPNFFVITEFCERGNLFELLHQSRSIHLNWEDKRRIATEIAQGMNYLHSFNPPILHRDLKSMNVLLNKYFQVKIADFGSTKFLDIHMTKQKGTFQWMAPEVIKYSTYTEKADVFSFAIILNELAVRQPPYYGVDKKEVARKVSMNADYRPTIPKNTPKEYTELMVKCWDANPVKRPNFNDIIESLKNMKLK